jgi:hypothetical protein
VNTKTRLLGPTALIALLGTPALAQTPPASPSAPPSALAPASVSPASAPPSTAPTPTDGRRSALTARVHLKVVHPDQVRRALARLAVERGGHATRLTDAGLALKLPPPALGDFLRALGDHGLVLTKTLARQDLTETIADLEGRLRSKGEIFAQLRVFFDQSNLQATLDIERTMAQLVHEMESIKGQLRVERDRTRWALVEIDFTFTPKDRLVYVDSPFEWLNTVDLPRFLSEFEAGE